jgi:triacylglycerol lipase
VTSRNRAVSITAALVIVIALAASAAVWFRANQDADVVAQDRQGPVLLVPGRAADSGALADLQIRIFLTGRRAIIVSTGIEDNGDLQAQATQIQRTAQELIDDGAPSVDVVGYSAGGVVVRLWLTEGGSELARRVVTIAAPNQGASDRQLKNLVTARYCSTTCPQLKPDSKLLKKLPDATGPAPWMNLWSARDGVVSSPSAQLPGALNVSLQSICGNNRSGHGQLLKDPLVVGLVLKAIDVPPLTAAPSKAECSSLRTKGKAASILRR